MGVDKSAIQNGRLYAFIDQWYDTPYRFGGLDKGGIDCSGLAFLLEQEVYGITIPRMTSKQINVIKREYEEDLKEGDLVFLISMGKSSAMWGFTCKTAISCMPAQQKASSLCRFMEAIYKYFSRAGTIVDTLVTAQTE